MAPTVLITRPEDSGIALAEELRGRWGCGVDIILSPMLQICWQGDLPDLAGVGGLIFTSRHGVEAFARLTDRRDIPCFAVGPASARRARAEGFETRQADGDADALVSEVLDHPPRGDCLHIRGVHVAGDVAGQLNRAGRPTREAILYDQVSHPLTAPAKECLRRETPVILPLYSPRSAALFFDGRPIRAPLFVAAISANVADRVPAAVPSRLVTARKPETGAMLEALEELLEEAKRLEGPNLAQ